MATTIRIALLALLIATPASARAGESPLLTNEDAGTPDENVYYRWIDSDGQVQYTDFEPVGVPAQRISLDPGTDDDAPPLSRSEEDPQSDPFHDQDLQILPIEHFGPCADARRQLAALHAPLPVYEDESGSYRRAWRGDTYRGDRNYLDAEARTAAIRTARAAVLVHCSDPEAFEKEVEAFREKVKAN